ACGNMRLAILSEPEGSGTLATSNLFCRGGGAEVEIYLGPLVAGNVQVPVATILGDPVGPFVNPAIGTTLPRFFGSDLEAVDDMNGDGVEDLLVGAAGARGEAYVVLMGPEVLSFTGHITDLVDRGLA